MNPPHTITIAAATFSLCLVAPAFAQLRGELNRPSTGRRTVALPQAPTAPPPGPSTWSTPSTVASSANNLLEPSVAVNAAGALVTAWTDGGQVFARVNPNGAWGATIPLSPAGVTSSAPVVSVDAAGNAVAAWIEGANPASSLRASFYTGGTWQAPFTLAGPGLTVESPAVRFSGTGEATLAWSQTTGGVSTVLAATGTPAGGWSGSTTISGALTTHFGWIRLAANAPGEVLVAMSNPTVRSGGNDVYAARRSAAGAWDAPVLVGGRTYRSGAPHVALADGGTAVILWADAYGPLYARRAPDLTWSVPTAVDPGTWGLSYTGANDLAIDAQGNALAVLGAFDATWVNTLLYSTKLGGGSYAWTAPILATDPNGSIGSYQLAGTPAGSFVIGWNDTNYDALGNLIGSGASTLVAGAAAWERTTFGSGDYSAAAAAAAGHAAVIWNTYWAIPASLDVSTRSVK